MLKLLAVVTMLIDHIGVVFFPGEQWWRIVGRIAFPLFAFGLARGYAHTRDLGRYLRRLAVFALVSQVPFSWMLSVTGRDPLRGSIMVTWLVALGLLVGVFGPTGRTAAQAPRPWYFHPAARGALIAAAGAIAWLVPMDYRWYGALMPAMIYLAWFSGLVVPVLALPTAVVGVAALTLVFVGLGQSSDIQFFAVAPVLALPLLLRYEQSVRLPRMFFYWFYPVHIAALAGLHTLTS